MRSLAPSLRSKRIGKICLFVLFATSTALATTVPGSQNLGDLGASYSFRMGKADNSQRIKHVFLVGNAVENAQLATISGNGYPDANRPSPLNELAISFGNSGQLIGYAFRAHGPVPPVPTFGPLGDASKIENNSGQAFRYSRDAANSLWWAEPA